MKVTYQMDFRRTTVKAVSGGGGSGCGIAALFNERGLLPAWKVLNRKCIKSHNITCNSTGVLGSYELV